ncbi:MAG: hypothetical protein GKR95_01105 [Gammaproteobacteria bacterium]|nr:hypothetical protein [Gammaproteobacteria bacterium]
MMSDQKQPTLSRNYEISGNTIPRQFRHWTRMKTGVMGNYDTGPGLKNLIILWVLHKVGKPIFFVRTWLNNQYELKQRLKRVLGR